MNAVSNEICRPYFSQTNNVTDICEINLDESNEIFIQTRNSTCVPPYATPMDIYTGLTLTWEIDPMLAPTQVDNLMIEVMPLLAELITESYIGEEPATGNRTRIWSPRGKVIIDTIEQLCSSLIPNEVIPDECCRENTCDYCRQFMN